MLLWYSGNRSIVEKEAGENVFSIIDHYLDKGSTKVINRCGVLFTVRKKGDTIGA